MTREQLLAKYPHASASFIKRNADKAGCAPSCAQPQSPVQHDALAAAQGKDCNPARVQVRITSYRRRLLDADNLAGGCKYFVDCCRYAHLIIDDRPQDIELVVRQQKVSRKEDERTLIEIEPMP